VLQGRYERLESLGGQGVVKKSFVIILNITYDVLYIYIE
jgi:hypothetical protein